MKKKTIALLLAAAMTLAGCGGKAEAPASTGGDDAGTEAPAETGGDDAEAPAQSGAKDNADITIGFSSKDNSDTFVAAIADAAQARADELGVKLVMYDAGGDVNKQISDVETMIAQKVDAVIVIPQSVEGSAPVVGKCNDAGIPIIIDNGDIADTNFTAFVGCTDQESGEILGQWFVDNVEKGSKVCIIEGPMGQSGQVGRYAGFEAVGMLEHFEVLSTQTANWKRDEAMALVEDWITQYGEIGRAHV